MEKETKETVDTVISHGYFHGHQCQLTVDKVSTYGIKCGPVRKFFLDICAVQTNDIRARNMYRSYAALCAEKYRQYTHYPFSLHPFSTLRFWIEVFFIFALLVSNVVVAVHISENDLNDNDIHNCALQTINVLYIFNIFFNFFTGYVEGNTYKYVVLDLRRISCHYAKTWLIIDLVPTSCCLIRWILNSQDITSHLLLVSTKILRLPILFKYVDNVLTAMRTGLHKETIVKILLFILCYLSWNIFFQFAVEFIIEGSFQPKIPRNCSWITIGNLWNDTSLTRFVYALDRAVGMLRKNSNMNLTEQDVCFEVFFVVSWLIAKLLVYHCVLKYIVSLFGSESARAKYCVMTRQVETYMKQRKFPPRIKKKILKFYSIRFQSKFFEEARMLDSVTGQLREDIIMHLGGQQIRELELIKLLPRALLLQIGLQMRTVIFIAGDIIFKINSVGDCLYYVDKGTVAIYSESGMEICHLEDGEIFGEGALVMKHHFRTASAVAVTNCELFRLDKEDFESTVSCYPTVYEEIKKAATHRYERTCVLDEHHKTEKKMEDDFRNDDRGFK